MRVFRSIVTAVLTVFFCVSDVKAQAPARVYAYGDSNTFGTKSGNTTDASTRHTDRDMWFRVLEAEMRGTIEVIANGRIGRAVEMQRAAGGEFIPQADADVFRDLVAAGPFRIVLVMLGTNDVSGTLQRTATETAAAAVALTQHLRALHRLAYRDAAELTVVLVAPPAFGDLRRGSFQSYFAPGALASRQLGAAFLNAAAPVDILVVDSGQIINSPGGRDGVHLSADDHRAIGLALVGPIRRVLER